LPAPKKNWHIKPKGPLRGTVRVPGDKSISHRALLINALASGPARVTNLLQSDDVRATVNALRQLGVDVETEGGTAIVRPPKDGLREPLDVIDCGNSGTTIRLLAGVLASRPFLSVLTGDASLRKRPMDRVLAPLKKMGAHVDGRDGGKLAPIAIRGGRLQMIQHALPVASAQVKSALILAGLRDGVAVREPGHSRDHTERMLIRMGVPIRRAPDDWLVVLPREKLEPLDVDVPGDISAAAFFLVGASIVEGSELYVKGVGVNPSRTGILEALDRMGADLQVFPVEGAGAEPQADLLVRSGKLIGTRIDGELALRCLDELPVIAIAAAFAEGDTVIADAAELRVKESDRITRTVTGLRSLGIQVEERPDGMVIHGGRPAGVGVCDATGDHRIAMAFAIAGCAVDDGVMVVGADAVSSSYPEFAQHLESLRG
jgi:3-phosphoshikimate 1-carboxyvinyltransferase